MTRRLILVGVALLVGAFALARPPADAPAPPVLVGKITDPGGRGIAGAKVTLYGGMATRFEGQTATTDEKGEYRFEPLSTGMLRWDEAADTWHISVGMRVVHGVYASADGETWWEIDAETREGVAHRHDLQLAKGGKIRGEVLNARGDYPVGDLSFKIEREDHSGVTYARTDHRGRFESEAMGPGEYVVLWNSPLMEYVELARVAVQRERATKVTIRITVSVTARAGSVGYEMMEGEEKK